MKFWTVPLLAGLVILAAALLLRGGPRQTDSDRPRINRAAAGEPAPPPESPPKSETPTAQESAVAKPAASPAQTKEKITVHAPPADGTEKSLLLAKLYGSGSAKEKIDALNRLFPGLHKPGFQDVLQGFSHAAQNDQEPDVRRQALYYLVREPHVEAFDVAMTGLVRDPATPVRVSILEQLDKLATRPDSYEVFLHKYLGTLYSGDPSVDVDKRTASLVRERRKQFLETLEKISGISDDPVGAMATVARLKEALARPR